MLLLILFFLSSLHLASSYMDFCVDQYCREPFNRIYSEQCYSQEGFAITNDTKIPFTYIEWETYSGYPAIYFFPNPCLSWNYLVYFQSGPGCYGVANLTLDSTPVGSIWYTWLTDPKT